MRKISLIFSYLPCFSAFHPIYCSDSYTDIHSGIKLHGGNVGCSDGIYSFPYFCTFLLKRWLKAR